MNSFSRICRKNYGPGTLEIFRVQGKPCMRFMQAHTGRCLLSTRLTTAAYSALPSRQNGMGRSDCSSP